MKFHSTRNHDHVADFTTAIFRGLAPDGGLYHPTSEPDLHSLLLGLDEGASFHEIAAEVIAALLPETFDPELARTVCREAFPFSPELRRLTDQIVLLELFHGPSCAFKDFGASFLATAMEHLLDADHERAVILTATSGDTGSAVAHAFYEKPNIDVVVLYPSGRVSPLQEKQLTTLGGNISALEIEGSFDDCQRMAKSAFVDRELADRIRLTSANSINLGRLIPQALYYIYAFVQLRSTLSGEFHYCVPSGNFGNLTAGVFSWRWGLPAASFIAATNVNDVVPEYLSTGVFEPRQSIQTVANAMDVGDPSNFERMREIFDADYQDMAAVISAFVATDDLILETMKRYFAEHAILLDPHTAAGVAASEHFLDDEGDEATIISLATAHPAKFSEIVMDACGVEPELPQRLAAAMAKEKVATKLPATDVALREFLLSTFA